MYPAGFVDFLRPISYGWLCPLVDAGVSRAQEKLHGRSALSAIWPTLTPFSQQGCSDSSFGGYCDWIKEHLGDDWNTLLGLISSGH